MKQLTVQSSTHAYEIIIAKNVRHQLNDYLKKSYSSILVITDDQVAKLYLNDIMENFDNENVFHVIVPSGEKSKDFETYHHLQTEALKLGLDRNALIIALGGGVIGDLAGFVAATFLRGIDYIQVPTTILAHDSSVGGKVAINHELGKNLIGSFYPPRAVIYDVETLVSLSDREVRSGYAELIKEAFIADADFLQDILNNSLDELTSEILTNHLQNGIKIKADIVEQDEKESGVRKFLNLGHTLAHAIEAELGYGKITHGEAVAIGTLFALEVSEHIFDCKLPIEAYKKWLISNKYPLKLPYLNTNNLIKLMKLDKKVVNKKIQMVLLSEVGKLSVEEIDDETLNPLLKKFISELIDE